MDIGPFGRNVPDTRGGCIRPRRLRLATSSQVFVLVLRSRACDRVSNGIATAIAKPGRVAVFGPKCAWRRARFRDRSGTLTRIKVRCRAGVMIACRTLVTATVRQPRRWAPTNRWGAEAEPPVLRMPGGFAVMLKARQTKGSPMRTVHLTGTILLVLGLFFSLDGAAAQVSDAARQACTPDAMRLCSDVISDVARVTACMKAKSSQVSPACRVFMHGGTAHHHGHYHHHHYH
jgi:hypothetical protein